MAVSIQSTSSGGTINFSEGDTLTVNGKIVAENVISAQPTNGIYSDIASKTEDTFTAVNGTYTYTFPVDGLYTISYHASSAYNTYTNVLFNGVNIDGLLGIRDDSEGEKKGSYGAWFLGKAGDTLTITSSFTFFPYTFTISRIPHRV